MASADAKKTNSKQVKLTRPVKDESERKLVSSNMTAKMAYEHMKETFIATADLKKKAVRGRRTEDAGSEDLNQCFMDFVDINFDYGNTTTKYFDQFEDIVWAWENDAMIGHGCLQSLTNVTTCYSDTSPFEGAKKLENACKKSGGHPTLETMSATTSIVTSNPDYTMVNKFQYTACVPTSCSGIEEVIENFIALPEFYYGYYDDEMDKTDDYSLDDWYMDDTDDYSLDDLFTDDFWITDDTDDFSFDDWYTDDYGVSSARYDEPPSYNITITVGTYEKQSTFYCTEKATENFFFKKKKGVVETKTCKQLSMFKAERIHEICIANESKDGVIGAADACPKTCCNCMEEPGLCQRLLPYPNYPYYDQSRPEVCELKGVSFSGKPSLNQECPQSCQICPTYGQGVYY